MTCICTLAGLVMHFETVPVGDSHKDVLAEKPKEPGHRRFFVKSETDYATRSFLLIVMFVWHGCPLIKNRAEITGWHKQSQVKRVGKLR